MELLANTCGKQQQKLEKKINPKLFSIMFLIVYHSGSTI